MRTKLADLVIHAAIRASHAIRAVILADRSRTLADAANTIINGRSREDNTFAAHFGKQTQGAVLPQDGVFLPIQNTF